MTKQRNIESQPAANVVHGTKKDTSINFILISNVTYIDVVFEECGFFDCKNVTFLNCEFNKCDMYDDSSLTFKNCKLKNCELENPDWFDDSDDDYLTGISSEDYFGFEATEFVRVEITENGSSMPKMIFFDIE
jgi:hypothetical protein